MVVVVGMSGFGAILTFEKIFAVIKICNNTLPRRQAEMV